MDLEEVNVVSGRKVDLEETGVFGTVEVAFGEVGAILRNKTWILVKCWSFRKK